MADRYYVDFPIEASEVSISGDVARHVIQVMRKSPGDTITLFNGGGSEFLGRIRSVGKRSLVVEIEQSIVVDRERPVPIHIVTAMPKGDRQRFLVEKLVELGAASLTPLETSRSVVRLSQRQCAKLHRWVIEASQQCGRNQLMEVRPPLRFGTQVETAPCAVRRLIADPAGPPIESIGADSRFAHPAGSVSDPVGGAPGFVVLVGPEGGWSDSERDQAIANGWQVVSLGPTILRIETAAIAATSLLGRLPL